VFVLPVVMAGIQDADASLLDGRQRVT